MLSAVTSALYDTVTKTLATVVLLVLVRVLVSSVSKQALSISRVMLCDASLVSKRIEICLSSSFPSRSSRSGSKETGIPAFLLL